jgi:hypothetical protein
LPFDPPLDLSSDGAIRPRDEVNVASEERLSAARVRVGFEPSCELVVDSGVMGARVASPSLVRIP